MMRAAAMCALVPLLVACAGPAPATAPKTYTVGHVIVGQWTFPVQCDSSEYLRTLQVKPIAVQFVPAEPAVMARLGVPAHFLVGIEGNKILKINALDVFGLRKTIEAGKVYTLQIGHRDAWSAANGIWNVVGVEAAGG